LRTIFGRFRDADLKRAFETARPIQCADLVTGKGEWREVAWLDRPSVIARAYVEYDEKACARRLRDSCATHEIDRATEAV
jgi:hypothetical protein